MNRWLPAVLAALLALTGGLGTPESFGGATAAAQSRNQKARKASTRPGDTRATTKGLEEALKRTQTEAAPERQSPAKLDTDTEVSRDDLADQRRDEEIEALMRVLPRQRVPETRAELLFRLAELWWEKSKFVYMAEEMPNYQAARNAWFECTREKGEKACPAEPKLNNRKSEIYRNNAVQLYEQITTEHPEYRRNDEVRYILAYNKYELGQSSGKAGEKAMAEAVEQYRKLINLHPNSPFVADAYMQLGNHYFDKNQLVQARKAFEECVKRQAPATETYCIYKLAWCDINSGDQLSAVDRFKTVIARSKSSGQSGDRIRLGGEALRDIIGPFSQLSEKELSDEEKINFLIEAAGQQGSREYISALASVYFNAGRYDQSINIYRYMLGEHPNDPSAPAWQSSIVLAYDKLNRRDLVVQEMERLVDAYRPTGAWAKTNASNASAIRIALSLTEEALYNLVTDYHQEAIKTKTVKTYLLARDIYKKYIDNFPETERSYQMRYYYAEILFALEDFQPAYEQYRLVAFDKERDDYKRVSAENMLLSASRLVCIEQGRCERTVDETNTRIDERKSKGTIERKAIMKVDKDAPEQPLTDMEKQFVTACDEYVEVLPNAADEAEVRLAAAVLYFERVQYLEAANRFSYIIGKWPDDKSSSTAAAYVLESLEIKEEWQALNRLAREFSANKRLLAGRDKTEFRNRLPVYIEGSQFNHAMEVYTEKKDYPEAARLFRDFVAEFGKSKYSPVALYNAFVIFNKAEELDTAIAMAEQLLRDYPKVDGADWRKLPNGTERDPILPLLVFDLAKAYERTADFGNAARYYEQFAADFSSDPRAPDAQYNAGYWYQGLGEYDKAVAAYEKYIRAYRATSADRRKELAPEPAIFFEVARIFEQRKDWRRAAEKFDEYVRVYRNEDGWKLQNAMYRRFLALLELGRSAEANQLATEIVRRNGSLSEQDRERDTSRLAAAHARFHLLEPRFDAYTKIRFESPRTLRQRLEQKIQSMAALRKDYEEVVNYLNGDYAIAALVRMAALPRDFARSLLDAPIPPGLDWEQEELYRSVLESEALKYEEPAVEALETAVEKSFELGIYNRWSIDAQNALAEFKPDAFGEIRQLPLQSAEFFFTFDPVADAQPQAEEGAGGD